MTFENGCSDANSIHVNLLKIQSLSSASCMHKTDKPACEFRDSVGLPPPDGFVGNEFGAKVSFKNPGSSFSVARKPLFSQDRDHIPNEKSMLAKYFRVARYPQASDDLPGLLVLRLKGLQGIVYRGEPVNSAEPRIYSFATQPLAHR